MFRVNSITQIDCEIRSNFLSLNKEFAKTRPFYRIVHTLLPLIYTPRKCEIVKNLLQSVNNCSHSNFVNNWKP